MINMKRCNMSLERLASIGVDVDEAMDRFMNNEMMCIKFFKKLLNDDNFALLQEAFKTHDLDNAIAYAHTLKGVCGNLAIKPLYHIFDEMVKAEFLQVLAGQIVGMDELEDVFFPDRCHRMFFPAFFHTKHP